MTTHDDEYASTGQFDSSGYSTSTGNAPTSTLSDTSDEARDSGSRWHGGADLGLLVVRVVVGVIMAGHGAQKLFGWFDGPGIGPTAQGLASMGYTSQTTLLAWVTALTETGGGLLLILGLFTPLGAAAILGVMGNILYLKAKTGFFMGMEMGTGFEYELLIAAVAFALLFTGPGRISIDVNTPWRRKPVGFGFAGLLLAAAASLVVILVFR
ncbi:DoxX family protein [Amycolatopsis anabasis]|uniref:DoxX family protein n=1 Tax=Amycolatopsis anabasis TaxID=1840409 RepID=UPI001FE3BA29|nr:DoxX family protein [Amycolatopsis anabasis]